MNQQAEDIKTIREIMEKSTKFQALNGLSIAIAGIIALLGAYYVYSTQETGSLDAYEQTQDMRTLLPTALVVLGLSLVVISLFCGLKARKNHQKLLNTTTLRAVYHLAIPLVTGGVFSFIFLWKGYTDIAVSSTLIFYGLGLVNASKYTFKEIHYLGILQIILGLFSAYHPHNNLLTWALGFGVLHIVFGIIMYIKYDRRK